MHVLIPNLHKDRSGLGEEVTCHSESIPKVRQIAVNPIPPRIPKRPDLLGLPGNVLNVPVLDVTARRRPLEVGVELDPVGRVDVDALHLSTQPFALGEGGHDLQAIAQDHAVRPVGVVLVELGLRLRARQAVEVGEEVDLRLRLHTALGAPHEVVDQDLGMDLLLDEERWRRYDEVGPVALVLAAPDELRVEVAVAQVLLLLEAGDAALVAHFDRALVLCSHHRLVLGGRDVPARRLLVGEGLDLLRGSAFLRHQLLSCSADSNRHAWGIWGTFGAVETGFRGSFGSFLGHSLGLEVEGPPPPAMSLQNPLVDHLFEIACRRLPANSCVLLIPSAGQPTLGP